MTSITGQGQLLVPMASDTVLLPVVTYPCVLQIALGEFCNGITNQSTTACPMAPDLVLHLDVTYPIELAKVDVLAWQAPETVKVPPYNCSLQLL